MSSLPDEITEENILTRLPVKSILRFRCVSKTWRLLFQNPNFIRKHLNHAILMNKFNVLVINNGEIDDISAEPCVSSVDYNVLTSTSSPFLGHALKIDYPFMSRKCEPDIVGSCNGLVCMRPVYEDICIWNPATREYTPVPEPPADDTEFDICVRGFGFDHKNDDYKVLKIMGYDIGEVSQARVYSLASDSWKELGSIPYNFSKRIDEGLLLNGVLHWIAIGHHSNGIQCVVTVCFDISNETFHDVPLPNNYSVEDISEYYIGELGIWEGKLCLLHTNQNNHIDVWTLMDNKWSKHLEITAQITVMDYERTIQTLQNGEILFQGGTTMKDRSGLILYDHKLETARALKIHSLPDDFEVETYIETLVPLSSGTYVGQ